VLLLVIDAWWWKNCDHDHEQEHEKSPQNAVT
jgi:hypothetical protein